MYIIEIAALDNGAHRNQSYNGFVPDGWALIREDVSALDHFPFGKVTAKKVDGVMTMTKWTPGELPEPEPEPTPEPTLDERVTDLEEALAETDETAIALFEAQEAQEEINAAQDDALIELFEMIGG